MQEFIKKTTNKEKFDSTTLARPQIHAILRDRIIHNELQPGSRISETEIAEQFSVSRQPVREAFIALSNEGLLEIRPQRGTYIKKISTRAVMDARFVRAAIEAEIIKLLCLQETPELNKELQKQLKLQHKAATNNNIDEFVQLDELFHRTLAYAADKHGAWHMLHGLKAQMDRVRYLSLLSFPMHKLLQQHERIASVIAENDAVKAEQAMRTHLSEIMNDLPEIVKAKPELFED